MDYRDQAKDGMIRCKDTTITEPGVWSHQIGVVKQKGTLSFLREEGTFKRHLQFREAQLLPTVMAEPGQEPGLLSTTPVCGFSLFR